MVISLEFLGKLSLQVKKQLNDIFRLCHKNVKLTVVFKSLNRIRMLFLSKNSYARVLTQKYFINTRATLAIMSKQHLLVRQYEHLRPSIFTNKALK